CNVFRYQWIAGRGTTWHRGQSLSGSFGKLHSTVRAAPAQPRLAAEWRRTGARSPALIRVAEGPPARYSAMQACCSAVQATRQQPPAVLQPAGASLHLRKESTHGFVGSAAATVRGSKQDRARWVTRRTSSARFRPGPVPRRNPRRARLALGL